MSLPERQLGLGGKHFFSEDRLVFTIVKRTEPVQLRLQKCNAQLPLDIITRVVGSLFNLDRVDHTICHELLWIERTQIDVGFGGAE